jgi:hypothetical protein
MKKELQRIMKRLNIIYKGLNPMIEIYGDGSWSVEIDGTYSGGNCRIAGEASGDSIDELEEFIKE